MAIKYLRKYVTPSSGVETALYTVPEANSSVVSSLRVTNTYTAATLLTVTVYPEGGATPYLLLLDYSLNTDQTMDVFSGVPCVMQAGDVLKVTANTADVDFYMSYMEMDRS
jgi:hypothetical protein